MNIHNLYKTLAPKVPNYQDRIALLQKLVHQKVKAPTPLTLV